MPELVVRRVREPREGEAMRVLVDRLWPRGVSKETADLDLWPKEATPSTRLRKAFHGGEMTFEQFSAAYTAELDEGPAVAELAEQIRSASGRVALLIAADPTNPNHADVLRRVLEHAFEEAS